MYLLGLGDDLSLVRLPSEGHQILTDIQTLKIPNHNCTRMLDFVMYVRVGSGVAGGYGGFLSWPLEFKTRYGVETYERLIYASRP